jgi:molybdate transport system permease protein
MKAETAPQRAPHRAASDVPFYVALCTLGGLYVFFIIGLLVADVAYVWEDRVDIFGSVFSSPEIRYSLKLSLLSCSITALLSLWVAVPIGYLLSRCNFPGKALLDAVLDIPIVLPPLVIGLSLLIFFQTRVGKMIEDVVPVTYAIPSVILAQFMVACAFAVRTMRATFDQIDSRREKVALTLGCSRGQAFWLIAFPEASRGMLTAGTLAWARALGEFGPILMFSGATRMRTEVLPTTVFLEMSIGNVEGAVAVSLLMVAAAVLVLVIVRVFGARADMFNRL